MPQNKNEINVNYLIESCNQCWPQITLLDVVDSTSNWLKNEDTYPSVCLAETQTNGRGRNGNRWQSPDAENIYLSFSWLFDAQLRHLPMLSLWIGIAVAETMEVLGVKGHGIKWPNDLYWQNKKVGGILIETSSASSGVIVGIGINTNVSMIAGLDQPWTSLSEILGETVDRNEFLVLLLDRLHSAMTTFASLVEDDLLLKWQKWDVINGKHVSFQKNGEAVEGVASGINHSGYLLVRLVSGDTEAFNTSISKVRW